MIQTAVPLIKMWASAEGRFGDVLSGQNINESAKRRIKETGKDSRELVLNSHSGAHTHESLPFPVARASFWVRSAS